MPLLRAPTMSMTASATTGTPPPPPLALRRGKSLDANRFSAFHRQPCRRPRIESTSHVYHIVVSRTFQYADGNQAAVSAFAMNRNRSFPANLWQTGFEAVQRMPICTLNMSSLELTLASNIEYFDVDMLPARCQFLHSNLCN